MRWCPVITMLLVMIPAMLTALGVVREKELGSITNLYVTPVTRTEFLLGKQLPYIAIALVQLPVARRAGRVLFHVPIKGSYLGLALGALLYVAGTTAFGLCISTFARTPDRGASSRPPSSRWCPTV